MTPKQMIKDINRNKLKIKHFLNIQSESDNYPSNEDYLYELVSLISTQKEKFNKTFNISYIKRRICTHLSADEHLKILNELVEDGYLFKFNRKEDNIEKNKYKIINHPWN